MISEAYDEAIRELKDENSRLHKLVAEKNFEIKTLLKKLESGKCLDQIIGSGDAASTKIIELSKKLREQNSDIETEKNKMKQLQKKCFDLEKQVNSQNRTLQTDQDDLNKSGQEVGEMKAIQDRLKHSEMKVYEYKNQIQSLKGEIKVLQRVISQEVGENISVQTLLNNPGSWKGRNQQIVSLQKKVMDLKKQISELGSQSGSSQGIEESDSSHSNISITGSREIFKIRQIEKGKRENIEKLTRDLKNLEEELASQKQKCEALKARNQILLNENKSMKQQGKMLLEKEKHDNELIEALMKKQALLKEALVEESKQKKVETPGITHTNINQCNSNEIQHLKMLLLQKEHIIKSMEEQLSKSHDKCQCLKEPLSAKFSEVESTGKESPANDGCLDNASKLQRESDDLASSEKLEILNDRAYNVIEALYLEALSERDALIRQVETLEKRSQQLLVQLTETQSKLQVQTRRSVTFEKKLGKLKEQGNLKSCNAGAGDANIPQTIEEVLLKLDIQKDENNALKAGLQSTLKSKEEDLKVYIDMLENAKKIFLNTVKQTRGT